jgi:carbon monoxide dehydrogenase subunit G
MELTNEFDVAAPIEQAWNVLTDLERIAPCLPGAQLQEVEGDEYRGVVKVKVGPVVAQYKGKAVFLERDDANHRAVLSAEGRDTRGQGNASATIEANLTPTDGGTHVVVETNLKVSGKVAQFGRGVMADVSSKLMDQFVVNLETTVLADDGDAEGDSAVSEPVTAVAPEAPGARESVADDTPPDTPIAPTPAPADTPAAPDSGPTAAPVVRKIESAEAAPLDLMDVAGGKTMVKLALPVVALAIVLIVLIFLAVR